MKIVIGDNYAGFGSMADDTCDDIVEQYVDDRANPMFVSFVEQHPDITGDLCIVEIPDEITDWMIAEYDNYYEAVFYVLDGKIHVETP